LGKLQIPKVENESLKDFIFRFINNNGVQEVNINNNTESGKKYHRTIFDIYRGCLGYDENIIMTEVYPVLEELINEKKLLSHICKDISRRVYRVCDQWTRPYFNSSPIDEYNHNFINIDKKLINAGLYGATHSVKDLKINYMQLINNLTIGADIEAFLENNTGNIVSAEPYCKGTKHEPFNFDSSNKWYTTSLDNVLFEFTIPPAKYLQSWINDIDVAKKYIKSIIPKDLMLQFIPSAELADSELQTENAKTFGCEPTLDVWKRDVNPAPKSKNKNLRSAGFHVHFGYEIYDESLKLSIDEQIVKCADLLLGVPALLIEPPNKRRELYGKAGECRFKPYGVEYRVLSSYFCSTDTLIAWVYNQSLKVVDFVNSNKIAEVEECKDLILDAINNSNKNSAKNLIDKFEITMP